ncbi:hypothetical protein THAOC_27997 [Thalassiosira oceanica]|uniref:Uncharacterized protein n=1 Tax=Thalassiosira oceanica TaxID=159749 RepID=K0S1J1_THAOC|nr:hypothetical protein THAOC_27997 [Thalassiosira oceanica]|eukprot:EJK52702.1 hypothetical protein THAOC_27997 [Thalassiosira oceanica]
MNDDDPGNVSSFSPPAEGEDSGEVPPVPTEEEAPGRREAAEDELPRARMARAEGVSGIVSRDGPRSQKGRSADGSSIRGGLQSSSSNPRQLGRVSAGGFFEQIAPEEGAWRPPIAELRLGFGRRRLQPEVVTRLGLRMRQSTV